MKLEMSVDNLKQIYKVCSAHISKSDYKPQIKYIHLTLRGELATAIALDGYKLAQCSVNAYGDEGTYILPICKLPKVKLCTIENTDKTMSIDFNESKHEELLPKVEKIDSIDKFIPKSDVAQTIGFNPDYMIKACASLKGYPVKMEIRDKVNGILLSNENGMVMILPVRLKEDK